MLGRQRGVPNTQGGYGLCQAPKIYEALVPRFIFDFHLIIFFPATFNSSVRRDEQRQEGGGMGPLGGGEGVGRGVPPAQWEPPQRPRLVPKAGQQEGEG